MLQWSGIRQAITSLSKNDAVVHNPQHMATILLVIQATCSRRSLFPAAMTPLCETEVCRPPLGGLKNTRAQGVRRREEEGQYRHALDIRVGSETRRNVRTENVRSSPRYGWTSHPYETTIPLAPEDFLVYAGTNCRRPGPWPVLRPRSL
jgi:hypothetical protein